MALFEQIGLNHTAVLQFIIFVITLLFLSMYVFKPYLQAVEEREKGTTGALDQSLEIQKETLEIQKQYESKAQLMSSEVKTIFDSYRDQANKEVQQIIGNARAESQKVTEEAKAKISTDMSHAMQTMKNEIPILSQTLVQKLISSNGSTQ